MVSTASGRASTSGDGVGGGVGNFRLRSGARVGAGGLAQRADGMGLTALPLRGNAVARLSPAAKSASESNLPAAQRAAGVANAGAATFRLRESEGDSPRDKSLGEPCEPKGRTLTAAEENGLRIGR